MASLPEQRLTHHHTVGHRVDSGSCRTHLNPTAAQHKQVTQRKRNRTPQMPKACLVGEGGVDGEGAGVDREGGSHKRGGREQC